MLEAILTALRSTSIPFEAYAWETAPSGPYGTAQLSGAAESAWADNKFAAHAVEGTVDLYVRGVGESERMSVQTALNSVVGLVWRLQSVQYEDDTRRVHFEWLFSFVEVV